MAIDPRTGYEIIGRELDADSAQQPLMSDRFGTQNFQQVYNDLLQDTATGQFYYKNNKTGKVSPIGADNVDLVLQSANFALATDKKIGETGIEPDLISDIPQFDDPSGLTMDMLNVDRPEEKTITQLAQQYDPDTKAAMERAQLLDLQKQQQAKQYGDVGVGLVLAGLNYATKFVGDDAAQERVKEQFSELRQKEKEGRLGELTGAQEEGVQALQRGVAAGARERQADTEAREAARGGTTSVAGMVAGRRQAAQEALQGKQAAFGEMIQAATQNLQLNTRRLDQLGAAMDTIAQRDKAAAQKFTTEVGALLGAVRGAKPLMQDDTIDQLYAAAGKQSVSLNADAAVKLAQRLRFAPYYSEEKIAEILTEEGLEATPELIESISRSV
tara:strand:- start:2142 stop:3299 length:1158 start_codon:yes stop_codon:yes gene_type:complete